MGTGGGGHSDWRRWGPTGASGQHRVVSARLSGEAAVVNSLFPKIRSWFALGALLELLSPLSLLRVLYPLQAVVWLIAGVAGAVPALAAAVVGGGTFALFLVQLARRTLERRAALSLGFLLLVDTAALVATARGGALAAGFGALFVPPAVFVALFFRPRVVALVEGVATLLAAAALVRTLGVAAAGAVALLGALGSGAAVCAVLVLARSAARRATTDADTGLPNGAGLARLLAERGAWDHYLVAAVVLGGVADAREAVGHAVGTELLRRAVEDLGQVLPEHALIGRVVADELVVVRRMPPPAGADGEEASARALAAAEAFAAVLAKAVSAGRYVADGIEISLRPHVGCALAPADGDDVEELIRRASLSAQRAATHGLGVVRWAGASSAMTEEDLALLADLRVAAARGELRLAYQPQIAAASGETVSVEALLRWSHARHGAVPPDRFIVLAERTGFIDRLTEWVVAEALDAQRRWRASGLFLPVSVNLSARSLTKAELAPWILAELAARDLPPTCLAIEVTETAAATDLAQAVNLLRPLHDRGVRISIDDFGVGYTSLSVLPQLPLSELKVDKHFVMRSPHSRADAAIVRTVRELTHRLGLDAVAEGVENAEVLALVQAVGYDLLQGYHFSRPLFEDELLAFVAPGAPRVPERPYSSSHVTC